MVLRRVFVLAVVALTVGMVGATSAYAAKVPIRIERALEILKKEPHLEDFKDLASPDKEAVEKSAAELIWYNKDYAGDTSTAVDQIDSLVGVAHASELPSGFEASVTDYYNSVSEGTAVLSDADPAVEAARVPVEDIGGEALETGVEATGGAAAGVAALIPIAAGLWYDDITTGDNPISVALFGPAEDHERESENEASAHESDVSPERQEWVRYPKLNPADHDCLTLSNCIYFYEAEHSHCPGVTETTYEELPECATSEAITRFGDALDKHEGSAYGGGSEVSISKLPHFFYLLESEVAGVWYIGSLGAHYGVLARPVKEGGRTVYNQYWLTPNGAADLSYGYELPSEANHFEATGCSEDGYLGGAGIKGAPDGNIGEVLQGEVSEVKCLPSFDTGPTITIKPTRRLRAGMPHTLTKSEEEALRAEGHTIPIHGSKPSTNTAELEALQKEYEEGEPGELENWLEHEMEAVGGGIPESPFPGTVTIPVCSSVVETCEEQLTELELIPEVKELDWEKYSPARGPGKVVELNPSEGTDVEEGEKVVVWINPTTPPKEVPKPGRTETGREYKEKAEKEGFKHVEEKVRPEVDPTVGPDVVSYTSPAPGTETNPDGETPIEVEVNPDDAPPAETHEGIGGPTEPGIHFPKVGVLCRAFPFGVPCWLIQEITVWSATSKAPVWGISSFTIMGHTISGASFDLAKLEPIMEIVRPAILVFATIGLVLLFYRFAMGGSPDSGSQGDSGAGSTVPQPDGDIYL